MRKTVWITLVIGICLVGCKKKENNMAGTIQFDLNGAHRSFNVTGSLQVIDTGAEQGKIVPIVSSLNTLILEMIISDASASVHSGFLSNGPYNSTDCNTMCNGFLLSFSDNTYGALTTLGVQDTTSSMVLTSGPGSPAILNGTFDCWVTDASGMANLHLLNGKITNVSY
ncbi:MAG: hypothetical protein JWO06_1772 [Bacteroidota bacterium]|nr:hypothetical protein [Bacteroidota bacterium]